MTASSEIVSGSVRLQTATRQEPRVCPKPGHGEYLSNVMTVAAIGREVSTGCPVCSRSAKAEREAKERAQAAKDAANRLAVKLERAGIPKRFRDRTFETYQPPNQSAHKALSIAMTYAENFEENLKAGRCLIFTGKTGTGKTHLANAIANQLVRSGYTAVFISVRELLATVKATWNGKRGEKTELQVIKDFVGVDLLILEEVGVQFDTDAEKLIMFDVINGRYENQRPTIVLSNYPVESPRDANGKPIAPSIRTVLGDRVIDRLRENGGRSVVFDWESFRRG